MDDDAKALKNAMIKMTRQDTYEYGKMTLIHKVNAAGKNTFTIEVNNSSSYNNSMSEEEAKALYSILHDLFKGDN